MDAALEPRSFTTVAPSKVINIICSTCANGSFERSEL